MTATGASADKGATEQATVRDFINSELPAVVQAVDTEGFYPAAILAGIGQRGGYGAATDSNPVALQRHLDTIADAGRHCISTSFLTWCQSASAWYLAQAPESGPRDLFADDVRSGRLLAGSGMSNFMKHASGIEKVRLTATPTADGYELSGILPWVSNLDHGHLLFSAAGVAGGGYIMFALPTDTQGLSLHPCPDFSGMEGTNTWNVRMKGVQLPANQVLAHPADFDAFIDIARAGVILTQVGMGIGLLAGCLDIIHGDALNVSTNAYLDTTADDMTQALAEIEAEAQQLARQVNAGEAPYLDILRLRAKASEWALKASQTTALHMGARGYLMRHPAQRRVREATFVAIVTPALKHLRQEIDTLDHDRAAA